MTLSRPEIAVVLSTYNRPQRLRALLASLRAQTLDADRFEVVVVDDASGPETAELLAAEAAAGGLRLTVVRRDEPGGPGIARDDGWRACDAPVIAFTDDDCVVDPRWLEAGLEAVAAAGPNTVIMGRTDPIPDEEHLRSPFSHTRISRGGMGFETFNIFYPRTVLESVGGFDPEFGWGGEDTDLGWRALDAGATWDYAAEARAFHAVDVLGPVGMLRKAAKWVDTPKLHARHRSRARTTLHHRYFWSPTHEHLLLFGAGALVARRAPVVGALLAAPYLKHLMWRRTGPLLAPYILAHDVVELVSIVRGGIRHRVLVI